MAKYTNQSGDVATTITLARDGDGHGGEWGSVDVWKVSDCQQWMVCGTVTPHCGEGAGEGRVEAYTVDVEKCLCRLQAKCLNYVSHQGCWC